MSAIFLSYRRDDSSGYAGRLYDNLAERFGRERVFMDIETLEPGMDFVAGIDRAIASCGAVIAMIGPNWVRAEDGEGRRRLDNPHDFIRLEIDSALTRNVRVIPVLVRNASMPSEQELPEPLRPLCRLQACEISDNRWEFDVGRLADVLEPLIAETEQSSSTPAPPPTTVADPGSTGEPSARPRGWLAVVAAVVLAAGAGAWWLSQSTEQEQAIATVSEPMPAPPKTATRSEDAASTVATPDPAVEATRPPPRRAEPSPESRPAAQTEPVAVPETPQPSAEDLRQSEIAELLRDAEIDIAELRLTSPAGNNAFERFQRVLELDPDHPGAREGLAAITERYHSLARGALERGALNSAQQYLDSARRVDPGTDWLTTVQREIDHRRRDTDQAMREPEPATPPGAADREACVAACENRHRACREEIDADTEAECLRSREATCEQRYESCMSDSSKLYMGEVSLESECIGVHMRCRRSAAKGCAAAPRIAEERCVSQFDACVQRCQGSD